MNPFGQTVLLGLEMPIGAIIIWSGLIASIPVGWQKCDGTNGTPNLTNRFVLGGTADPGIGTTGGAGNHSHPFTDNGHFHTVQTGLGSPALQAGIDYRDKTTVNAAAGTTNPVDGRPPFYILFYIMRLF